MYGSLNVVALQNSTLNATLVSPGVLPGELRRVRRCCLRRGQRASASPQPILGQLLKADASPDA